MIEHKDFFIYASALPAPPPSKLWSPEGIILAAGRAGSVVEVGRIHARGLSLEMKELAEWYGVELCRIAIDEYLTQPAVMPTTASRPEPTKRREWVFEPPRRGRTRNLRCGSFGLPPL